MELCSLIQIFQVSVLFIKTASVNSHVLVYRYSVGGDELMSVRHLVNQACYETSFSRQDYPSRSSTDYPTNGDFTGVFGTARMSHYNVEDWRASAQAFQ
jgi:hypothetical protein